MHRFLLLSAVLLAGLMPAAAHAEDYVPGEVIVQLNPGADPDQFSADWSAKVTGKAVKGNIFRLHLPNGNSEKAFEKRIAKLMRKDERVAAAECNQYLVSNQGVVSNAAASSSSTTNYNAEQPVLQWTSTFNGT